jgi:methionyl-tRNA synthetase
MKRYFTTPLYYVNAQPHLGHAYTTLLTDVLSRYYRQKGDEVCFLTGTDEHGQKIEQSAAAKGKDPKTFCDEVSLQFKRTWDQMQIQYDIYYRTTDETHKKAVQYALEFLKDRNEIEFREYEGQYCVGCEGFLNPNEMNESGECNVHKKKTEYRKEKNYFFLMSRYQTRLLEHYLEHPEAIYPEHFRNEVLSFLKQPLSDLCISRPKERLKWGIELPFDSGFVTYVWFDALLNYLVATGWPKKMDTQLWSSVTHVMAKDILKTHAVYWPTMLMALNVPVFHQLLVHGYWLMDGDKMSKSLGNVVAPLDLYSKYGEGIRFFFLKEMSFGFDAQFNESAIIQSLNTGLANGIGNLTSRVMTIVMKNFPDGLQNFKWTDEEQALLKKRDQLISEWEAEFDAHRFHIAMKKWMELVSAVDLYINEQKPWALAKDENARDRLETVLGTCLSVIRSLAIAISPVLPQMAEKVFTALGESGKSLHLKDALQTPEKFKVGGEVPKLFQRIVQS